MVLSLDASSQLRKAVCIPVRPSACPRVSHPFVDPSARYLFLLISHLFLTAVMNRKSNAYIQAHTPTTDAHTHANAVTYKSAPEITRKRCRWMHQISGVNKLVIQTNHLVKYWPNNSNEPSSKPFKTNAAKSLCICKTLAAHF